MPSHGTFPHFNDQSTQDRQQTTEKICHSCRLPFVVPINLASFLHASESPVCVLCRDHAASTLIRAFSPARYDPFDASPLRRGATNEPSAMRLSTHSTDDLSDTETELDSPSPLIPPQSSPETAILAHRPQRPTPQQVPAKAITRIPPSINGHSSSLGSSQNTFKASPERRQVPLSSSDPLVDITRIRIRSQSHHCLYPGATFRGTQKSGRNSYDVDVTIVDVDFTTSFLCGYLRIRGLTEDWPELTTYFDAEIIGSRYGFLTQNWGATEQEDMVHWQRFPAFKHVRNELRRPLLTMDDRDRGAVFMRWKERFLVPDHRVQDINGASFAGFYYVCVDFNPQSTGSPARSANSQIIQPAMEDDDMEITPLPVKPDVHRSRSRRAPNARRGGRSPSSEPHAFTSTATMNGFYFHQHSEPYQQLSLSHIPERSSSSFEFR